ncbi:DUF305 domain-containing protein [Streptomyces sp. BE282]|uniref:DUF305 domain-containing protein n=1 Tax=Streptomyces TaxID=1883 RepID=UPI001A9A2586|nr:MULTISPECIES: DUF305 domain-containing protein [unclassified Streptomyces]MEE1733966.1 DUF305 domain-containing protein [Streptomyces sp. BE282]MEE1734883.1 DUF305 domain-containing protein [Streptomyces sp. BE282]QTA35831.1 hypothetical protein JHY03_60430 [Streptomyces sp. CA-256286]
MSHATRSRPPTARLPVVAPILLALLGLAASAGCSTTTEPAPAASPVRTAVAPSPKASPSASSTPTDAAWAQLMTPMNEKALALLTLAADRGTEPRLRAFATRLHSGQEAELGRLRPLLARMGLPDTDVHAGHDMPGMVTEADLEAAGAAEGGAFDRLFLTGIRDHLRHSAQVSRSEITAGARADAKQLAADLVTAREAALTELEGLPGAAQALG